MTSPLKAETAKADQLRRLEQLLAISRRLADAIAADIAALEQGEFGNLTTTDPEVARLCALYGREVTALKASGGIKNMPEQLIATLKESGGRLNKLLSRHESLVACMRQASEGLIQAVAEEVDRSRKRGAPYSGTPTPKRVSSGAIVYNKVV